MNTEYVHSSSQAPKSFDKTWGVLHRVTVHFLPKQTDDLTPFKWSNHMSSPTLGAALFTLVLLAPYLQLSSSTALNFKHHSFFTNMAPSTWSLSSILAYIVYQRIFWGISRWWCHLHPLPQGPKRSSSRSKLPQSGYQPYCWWFSKSGENTHLTCMYETCYIMGDSPYWLAGFLPSTMTSLNCCPPISILRSQGQFQIFAGRICQDQSRS